VSTYRYLPILINVVNGAGGPGIFRQAGIVSAFPGFGPEKAILLETLLVPDIFFNVKPDFPDFGPEKAIPLEILFVPDLFFDIQPDFPGGERGAPGIPVFLIIWMRGHVSSLPGT
jgi:hypothetical protein